MSTHFLTPFINHVSELCENISVLTIVKEFAVGQLLRHSQIHRID